MICDTCTHALIQKCDTIVETDLMKKIRVSVICILTGMKPPTGLMDCSQATEVKEVVDLGYGAVPEVKKKGWPLGKKRKP